MPDGRTYKHTKYDEILKEQVIISYMSKGMISIEELDGMCRYDRRLVLDTLKEIREQEAESHKRAMGMRTGSRTSRFG